MTFIRFAKFASQLRSSQKRAWLGLAEAEKPGRCSARLRRRVAGLPAEAD